MRTPNSQLTNSQFGNSQAGYSLVWELWSGALGAVAVLLVLQPPAEAAGRIVTFRGEDGHTISGLLMEADQRPAPAVGETITRGSANPSHRAS